MDPIMARRSPRVTRRKTRSNHDDDEDDSDNSQYYSNLSTQSWQNDSRYSSSSYGKRGSTSDDSPYNANRTESLSSFLSDSPRKSKSPSSSGLYPNLSDDVDESGDSSFTRKINIKRSDLYPTLDSLPDQRPRKLSPSPHHERKRYSSQSPMTEGSRDSDSFFGVFFVIIIVIISCAILYLVTASSHTNHLSNGPQPGYDFFEEKIKILKESFPSQTNRFWATVSASARHVFEQQDPCYPSVILMASQSKNQQLNKCLAMKIASIFSSSFGVKSQNLTVDVEEFKHLDSDQQKLNLDNIMQMAFQQEGNKAFVISNVHLLSPRASLLLHGFCDGDNAPFKDVMIILTFQVDDTVVFKSVKEVEVHLTNLWNKGLDMDKLSALMSRVANNPVVLMAEKESTVSKLCS